MHESEFDRATPGRLGQVPDPAETLSVTFPLSEGATAYYSLSTFLSKYFILVDMINNITCRVNIRTLILLPKKSPAKPVFGQPGIFLRFGYVDDLSGGHLAVP